MIRTLIVLGMFFSTESTKAGGPLPEKTDLFQSETGGHAHYRIPGLVVTDDRQPPDQLRDQPEHFEVFWLHLG